MSDLEIAINNLNIQGYNIVFQRMNGGPDTVSDIVLINEKGEQERFGSYEELIRRGA